MRNNKGISNVVTTLIFILLAIIAIGIVWALVNGIIGDSTGQIGLSSKCIEASDLEITFADCGTDEASGSCTVSLQRGPTGTEIEGVVIRVSDGTNTVLGYDKDNLKALDIRSNVVVTLVGGTVDGNNLERVEVFPYFGGDDEINRQVCPNPTDVYP
jgi:flagellin-like protein